MLRIAYHNCYHHPLPTGHRFPMLKYSLLHDQLLYEGLIQENNFFTPSYPNDSLFLSVHDATYIKKLKELSLSPSEIRHSGFPLSKQLIDREWIIAGGTYECTNFAYKFGISFNIAGGTHHAFKDRAEGFCILNDQAVAAANLLSAGKAGKILIMDLDVHQGDGTANIFESEPRVFTFSMHGERNYPAKKQKSDLDIALPDKTGDKIYLKILGETLPELISTFHPDFIFYQAGVDVLETDKLGKLSLSIHGCRERDEIVLSETKKNNIPVVVCMGGGYSENISNIVNAHTNTFRIANKLYF